MTEFFNSLDNPEVVELLNNGAVGVIPTDTVYGLVARADSEKAIIRLYDTKSRERQPGTTIGCSIEQLEELGFPRTSLVHAREYWPNAVSIEMSAERVPSYLSAGQTVMAARIPNDSKLLELLAKTGPLMTTSANLPKQPTSTNLEMARNYFGDQIDFYVDGGDLSDRPPSTIIGMKPDGSLIVYRQGAVNIPINSAPKDR